MKSQREGEKGRVGEWESGRVGDEENKFLPISPSPTLPLLLLAAANFERRLGVADLVALPVFHDQLQLVAAGRDVPGQRQSELDMKVASPAAAAIVDFREIAVGHAL